ncbi:protein DEK isoform X1 [Gadus morhua]|uniref:protein DEK isoform X1 n=1 Tax=Gadus morhua TaxID=8049 RepID=UPI0011B6D6EB|nr:protein DEK-like isoform X1 [Gadus morhua]
MSEMEEVGVEVAPLSEEEVAVEVAPLSEEEAEETREDEPAETPTPDLSSEVTGKRTKKTVARLEIQMAMPKEKLKVEDGGGDKLGDIPRTNHMIGKLKPGDLKPLHSIMFDRPGKTASMRKNMRQFNGFPFEVNSKQFTKKRDKLLRWASLTNLKLRAICKVLDLEQKGSQVDLINRILIFLSAPKNSGKPLLSKKKKKSKKRLSAGESKPRPKSTSASPKKTKSGSKSKAIVMESSSDEDEEDEDDKAGARAEEEDDDEEEEEEEAEEEEEEAKESGIEKSDESEDDGDEEDLEDEEESPKAKPPARKPAAGKRPRPPTKKSPAPKKRSTKERSESEGEADAKPKKKARRAAPSKPTAKSKKADSSSNSKKTNSTVSEGSSGDDRPLIKMMRVAPSDGQLEETVRGLLKDADLEEVTMKQICQKVYDAYPDHDLASRKDFIKQTIKSLIT